MYWDKVLQEVMSRGGVPRFRFTNLEVQNSVQPLQHHGLASQQQKKRIYELGPKCNGAYFTKREAECMLLLLKGKTINKTAMALSLSPRTIEFYLKNMKAKVGCRTKFELIEIVLESNFLQNVDFV